MKKPLIPIICAFPMACMLFGCAAPDAGLSTPEGPSKSETGSHVESTMNTTEASTQASISESTGTIQKDTTAKNVITTKNTTATKRTTSTPKKTTTTSSTTTTKKPTTTQSTTTTKPTAPFVKKTIMFTGDSITDAQRSLTIEPGMYLGVGHASLVNDYYEEKFGSNSHTVLNSGISGNTLPVLMERFQRDVSAYNPDYVIVLIGVNDATYENYSTPETFRAQYEDFVQNYLSEFEKVVIVSPFLITYSSAVRDRVAEFASVVKEVVLSANRSNQVLIDGQLLFDTELEKVGWSKARDYSVDTIHLTPEKGYPLLANAIIEQLEKE